MFEEAQEQDQGIEVLSACKFMEPDVQSEELPKTKASECKETKWDKLCRVCSAPGSHEIFAKIPVYLHGNCNEYLSWQKPINQLLEETTGLRVIYHNRYATPPPVQSTSVPFPF